MKVIVGSPAPNFNALALMPDNSINLEFNLDEYLGPNMGLVFFYPMDFSYVDPTELIALNNRMGEFEQRNVRVVAVSTDSHLSHLNWKQTPPSKGGIGQVKFPIVSDITKRVTEAYGILVNDSVALRGCFLIDKSGILRNQMVFDFPVGRNMDEILRIIDAHQFYEKVGRVCPANWQNGDEGLIADKESLMIFLKKNSESL